MANRWPFLSGGIRDDKFIRSGVPMTKREIRAVTLSKLQLSRESTVLDIGAGTGSVTIECALKTKNITAIERNEEGINLIKSNAEAFDVNHVEVIQGIAPDDLPNKHFDRVFIGGSGGQLEGIFEYLKSHLAIGGILVANTITIENTGKILTLLKEGPYEQIEVVQMGISRSKCVGNTHMMIAENPITIVSAVKIGEGGIVDE